MTINLGLPATRSYQLTIEDYCNKLGWETHNIDDYRTVLSFKMTSGITQTLFIFCYGDSLEFLCPSGIKFKDENAIPGELSTALLRENSRFKVGFWAIEEIEDEYYFSMLHNAETSSIDLEYFHTTVTELINECEKFEQTISKVLSKHKSMLLKNQEWFSFAKRRNMM